MGEEIDSVTSAGKSLIFKIDSIIERIDPATLFPRLQPLEIELGSGDGTFLVNYARLHPERNFIGVERLLGRLRKMERKGQRAGLTNLRGIRIESSYFLQFLLPGRSAAALHVYFPDPWPKRKHWRHRLINERFPKLAQQALGRAGQVFLRTDDEDYFEQMRAVFGACTGFEEIDAPAELIAQGTDFEREFEQRGIRIRRAAYQKTEVMMD